MGGFVKRIIIIAMLVGIPAVMSFNIKGKSVAFPVAYTKIKSHTPVAFLRPDANGGHYILWQDDPETVEMAVYGNSNEKIGKNLKFKNSRLLDGDFNRSGSFGVLLIEKKDISFSIHTRNKPDSLYKIILEEDPKDLGDLLHTETLGFENSFLVYLKFSSQSFLFDISKSKKGWISKTQQWATHAALDYKLLLDDDVFIAVSPGKCKKPTTVFSFKLPSDSKGRFDKIFDFLNPSTEKKIDGCKEKDAYRPGSFVFNSCSEHKRTMLKEEIWRHHFTCREDHVTRLGGFIPTPKGYIASLHIEKQGEKNQAIFIQMNKDLKVLDTIILPTPSTFTDPEDNSLPHEITGTRLASHGDKFFLGISTLEGYAQGYYLLLLGKSGSVIDGPVLTEYPFNLKNEFYNFKNGDVGWVYSQDSKILMQRINTMPEKEDYKRSEDKYLMSYLTYNAQGIQLLPKGAVEFEFIDQFGNQIFYQSILNSKTNLPAWRFTPGLYMAKFTEESGQQQTFYVEIQ